MGADTDIEVLRAEIEAAQRRQRRARETMAGTQDPAAPAAAAPLAPKAVPEDGEPAETDIDLAALLARSEDMLKDFDAEIGRHPRVAVVGALALGIVVGSLLSR